MSSSHKKKQNADEVFADIRGKIKSSSPDELLQPETEEWEAGENNPGERKTIKFEGIWKGLGFEEITDLEQEIRNIREESKGIKRNRETE
ncbi:MAG: hypothetical protein GY765_00145 [bacterium]|nr:hypothetical protein [bacterium]